MSYIGASPIVGNFQVCDAISVVNNQAAYTMQVGGVNVFPETANHMLVSLNGILQKAGSSFTVSGSTITFASNLVTGDVIDFIQILGNVLDLGVPSDNTVSLAKLTATGTKDATTFLRGDNSFAAVTSPDVVLLATNTITSGTPATTSFDGYFSSTYKNYVVYFNHLIPATDDVQPYLRVRQSNSDVTTANAYGFANAGIYREDGSGDGAITGGGNDSAGELTYNRGGSNVAADGGFSGIINITDPLNATTHKILSGRVDWTSADASVFQTVDFVVRFEGNTAALSGITLYFSSGNITTGVLKLYGIK